MKKTKQFSPGDNVFAKVKGYPAWPARVEEELGKKFKVFFYGTGETGVVKSEDLFSYVEHKEQFTKSLKRKDYNDALEEIEAAIASEEKIKPSTPSDKAKPSTPSDKTKPSTPSDKTKPSAPSDKSKPLSTPTDKTKLSTSSDKSKPSTPSDKMKLDVAVKNKSVAAEKTKPVTKSKAESDSEDPKPGQKRKLSQENVDPFVETVKVKKMSSAKSIAETKKIAQNTSVTESKPIKESSKKMDTTTNDEQNNESKTNSKELSRTPKKTPKQKKSTEAVMEDVSETEIKKYPPEKQPVEEKVKPTVNVITFIQLNNIIIQSEKLQNTDNKENVLKNIPPPLQDGILLARIEYDNYIGIKLNRNRPSSFKDEMERFAWEQNDAESALELKEKIENGTFDPQDKPEFFVMSPELTKEQLNDATATRIMERKKKKLRWLKIESCLVEMDSMIKSSLGLDKADPEKALKHLDTMLTLQLDPLMLKKHSHVVDMIKRLRRYIGNVKEWKLKDQELVDFQAQAEQIRVKADSVYNKFKELFTVPENTIFWEFFQDQISKFKKRTKDMAESQVFALCAEPGSKQALWDELDNQEEIKIISAKVTKKQKENTNDTASPNEEDENEPDDQEGSLDNNG